MQKLFFEKYKTSEVTNTRSVINTPSAFTRKNFFHIQEAGYVFFSTVPGNTPTSVRMKIHGNFSGSISTVPRPGHIIPISGITITGISALLISQN